MNILEIEKEINSILAIYDQAENKQELDNRLKELRRQIGIEPEEKKEVAPQVNSINDPEYEEYKKIALENGIPSRTYYKRTIAMGWSYKRASTEPINRIYPKEYIELRNKYRKIAERNGIKKNTFINRVERGIPLKEAATKPTRTYKKKVRA